MRFLRLPLSALLHMAKFLPFAAAGALLAYAFVDNWKASFNLTITPQEQQCVITIMDEEREYADRMKAAELLMSSNSSIVARQLAKYLPARRRYDRLTQRIVVILGNIGDPVALPAFERLELNAGEDHIFVPGTLSTAIYHAKEACAKHKPYRNPEQY